jgi:serine/threonine protein kinase
MSTFDWIGKSLAGRYQIQDLVGQGGMSAVYKAYDTNLKRTVAIKMIHTHLSSESGFVNRFEEEATAIAQLRHSNIVQVYDFNNEDQTYYMVVEFIPGETLQDQLKRLNAAERRMPLKDVVEYMVNICQAADYAHNRGVVHRDIKPANIMLSIYKQAILMDFGVSKIVGGQQHTATGAVVGTALYMSPEQIMGQQIDRRSDIYALGVTLFEMVSGHPPFEADSAMTIMMMHINDPVPDLREINPKVPSEMVAVINKALAKTAVQRYQTAGEMAAALQDVLGKPAEAPPAVPPASLIETLVEEPLTSEERPETTAATTPESTLQPQEVQPEAQVAGAEASVPPLPPAETGRFTRLSFLRNMNPLYMFGSGVVITAGLIAIIFGGLYFSGTFPRENDQILPATTPTHITVQPTFQNTVKPSSTPTRTVTQITPSSSPSPTPSLSPTPSPSSTPSATPTHAIVYHTTLVLANAKWTQTSIDIEIGDYVRISVKGQWTNNKNRIEYYGPNGHSEWTNNSLLPNVKIGTLIGRIGNNTPFIIGSSKSFTASHTGTLRLSMNDSNFTDNAGEMNVTVIIE